MFSRATIRSSSPADDAGCGATRIQEKKTLSNRMRDMEMASCLGNRGTALGCCAAESLPAIGVTEILHGLKSSGNIVSRVQLGREDTPRNSTNRHQVAVVTSSTILVTPANRRTYQSNDLQADSAFSFRSRGHPWRTCAVLPISERRST